MNSSKFIKQSHPQIASEWNYEKNQIDIDTVKSNSSKSVWWKCKSCNQEWQARVYHRTEGHGCPYCSGRRPILGENDLATWCELNNSKLLDEWDFSKNTIKPQEVTFGSGKKVWWKCSKCSHEWMTPICNRSSNGRGCPVCANESRRRLKTINTVMTKGSIERLFPGLMSEWDYSKNEVLPSDVSAGSSRKVWWICPKCNKEYKSSIYSRTKNKTGCPACGKLLASSNRLKSLAKKRETLTDANPVLLREWDYEKNIGINPEEVTIHSSKKVWWICSICGKNWLQRVDHRSDGVGCPFCARETQSSFPEQAIYYYISKYFPDAINGDREQIKPYELDIFIPSVKVAVEYDGQAYHSTIERDIRKNHACIDKGIKIYRIREKGCPELKEINDVKCYYITPDDYNELGDAIHNVLVELGIDVGINVDANKNDIYSQYVFKRKSGSLEEKYPEVAKEWDYNKNGNVTPAMVYPGTRKKVWWICPQGHSYYSAVSNRTSGGTGCPYCSKQKLLIGFNDFLTCYPNIAKEWDYEKNDNLKPTDVVGGLKKVWWKCPNGHSYKMSMNSRTNRDSECPFCNHRKVLPGFNDLATMYPDLVKEWDKERNGTVTPDAIMPGSRVKVWWVCPQGHSYASVVSNRTSGRNCPICAGKVVVPGINDLKSRYPEIANQWNYNKNKNRPDKITSFSNKRVWWVCPQGHEYSSKVVDKVKYNTGCPICCNKTTVVGYNDLSTTNAELVSEWNYDRNSILPSEVVAGTAKKVWWKCSTCSYEWFASIASRTKNHTGCPICGIKKQARSKQKRVINLDTGEIFDSIKSAKEKYGSNIHIKDVIKGERVSAGGYRWAFYNEEQ